MCLRTVVLGEWLPLVCGGGPRAPPQPRKEGACVTLEGEAMGYALAALAPPPHSSSGDDGPPPPEVPDADDDLFDAAEALEALSARRAGALALGNAPASVAPAATAFLADCRARGACTLNEFRVRRCGLAPHTSFAPLVSVGTTVLAEAYDDVDDVELLPGLLAEVST